MWPVPFPYILVLKVKAMDTRVINIEFVELSDPQGAGIYLISAKSGVLHLQKAMVRCDNCSLWCNFACVGLNRKGLNVLEP